MPYRVQFRFRSPTDQVHVCWFGFEKKSFKTSFFWNTTFFLEMSFYNSKMLSPLIGKIFSISFECIRGDLWGGANIGQHSGTSWIKRSAFVESFNNIIPKPTTLNSGYFWVPSLISVNIFTKLGQIATKLKFLLCFFKQFFFDWNQTRSFHLTVGSCSATI